MRGLTLLALSVAVSGSAFANAGISVAYGLYYPSSKTIRDALGGRWESFGFSPGVVGVARGMDLQTDFNGIYREANGNRIFIGTFSVGLIQNYAKKDTADVRPYVALRGSISYADYNILVGSTRFDRTRALMGWNAEAGVVFSDRLVIAARYDGFQKSDGLRFDGFSLNAQLQLLRF